MIILKSPQEIEILYKANQAVAEILIIISENVLPGATTWELDKIAEKEIKRRKVKPAFKGYNGYPANLCASVNEEVIHGIPNKKRILKEGDIVGIDFGVFYEGFAGDAAITCAVGETTDEAKRLMRVTEESLYLGIEAAVPGNSIGDISAAVENHVVKHGYSPVRDFVGHGIGRQMHEDPQVPNYKTSARGPKIEPGIVIAIEPMINMGTADVRLLADGWTAVTADGALSAHYEHSIAVTEKGTRILSKL